MTYAYLGPEGTFSEMAVRRLPAAVGEPTWPCPTVAAVLRAVRSVRPAGAPTPPTGQDRCSLVITPHDAGPGVLVGVLGREVLV